MEKQTNGSGEMLRSKNVFTPCATTTLSQIIVNAFILRLNVKFIIFRDNVVAEALSVGVFYHSASTAPCHIHLAIPTYAINQTMVARKVNS